MLTFSAPRFCTRGRRNLPTISQGAGRALAGSGSRQGSLERLLDSRIVVVVFGQGRFMWLHGRDDSIQRLGLYPGG